MKLSLKKYLNEGLKLVRAAKPFFQQYLRYSDRTHANMFGQQVTLIQIKLKSISGIQVA